MSTKAVLGFLSGVAAGAILGILFAPDSGKETRKKISRKTSDLGDNLKNSFNDLVDGLKHTYSNAKEEAEDIVETGKAKMGSYKNESRSSMA